MNTAASSKSSLSEQAWSIIRTAILNGALGPGAALPFQMLQNMCGMSVSPVREALTRLVDAGLVEVEHNRGYRVTLLSSAELHDITMFRIKVEGWAIEKSIELGDAEWEVNIVSTLHRLGLTPRDTPGGEGQFDLWESRHLEFHRALTAACNSPLLLQTCAQLYDKTDRYRRLSQTVENTPRDAHAEHKDLAKAVLDRNAPEAKKLLAGHYQRTAGLVAGYLANDTTAPAA